MEFFNLVTRYDDATMWSFQTAERRLYVAQTFMRGHSPLYPEKRPILLTPYEAADLALQHLGQIYVDKYKAVIDLSNLNHCSKLKTMALPTSPYLLYVALTRSKTAINIKDHAGLAEAVNKFIAARLKCRVDSHAVLEAFMELRYGEFYMTLGLNGESISERLCVIEHCNLKESASTFPSQLILNR